MPALTAQRALEALELVRVDPQSEEDPVRAALVATVLLAVVVGVTLGLLGGGGSILMVPLLVYVAGMETKEAIATSLVVVGVTAVVGVVGRLRGPTPKFSSSAIEQ